MIQSIAIAHVNSGLSILSTHRSLCASLLLLVIRKRESTTLLRLVRSRNMQSFQLSVEIEEAAQFVFIHVLRHIPDPKHVVVLLLAIYSLCANKMPTARVLRNTLSRRDILPRGSTALLRRWLRLLLLRHVELLVRTVGREMLALAVATAQSALGVNEGPRENLSDLDRLFVLLLLSVGPLKEDLRSTTRHDQT